MGAFTKEMILSIISEQIQSMDLDEMGRNRGVKGFGGESCETVQLPEPVTFHREAFRSQEQINRKYQQLRPGVKIPKTSINEIKMLSLNPDVLGTEREDDPNFTMATIDQLIPDVAICYEYIVCNSFDNYKLYIFQNYGEVPPVHKVNPETDDIVEKYGKKTNYILVDDDEPGVPQILIRNISRADFFGTGWKGAGSEKESEAYTKGYLHFKKINELFSNSRVLNHLEKCGIPPIIGDAQYGQPTSHKRNEAKYTAPNYNFTLFSMWPYPDMRTFLAHIFGLRESLMDREEDNTVQIQKMPTPTWMPRNKMYPKVYPRGHWNFDQRIDDPAKAKRTEKYKLWMKATPGISHTFYVGSSLQIIGNRQGREMTMSATFNVEAELRSLDTTKPLQSYNTVPQIMVHTRMAIPLEIDDEELENADFSIELKKGGLQSEAYQFLSDIYTDLMGKLGAKLLQINPDTAIEGYLNFEPEDVEAGMDLDESVRPKIIITESQLNELMKTVHAKPKVIVTESQLKRYLIEQHKYTYNGNIIDFFDFISNQEINDLFNKMLSTQNLDKRMDICDEILSIIQWEYEDYYDDVEDDIKELTLT